MMSTTLKRLSVLALLGLVCLLIATDSAQAQDTDSAAVVPVTPPAEATPILPATDDEEDEDDDEDEEEEEEEELEEALEDAISEEEFMISLEDSLVQFLIRHRDVRRDCDDMDTDLQIQAQSGEPVDKSLQQEYIGCMKYKRELEDNISELASRINKPSSDEPIVLPQGPTSNDKGFLSSITNRLPSMPSMPSLF